MAGTNGPKWPGPIAFIDDEPRKGFFQLNLTLQGMKTKGGFLSFFGEKTSNNAVFNDVTEMFAKTAILMKAKVTEQDGTVREYEYKKPLPEDIQPSKCEYKLKGDQIRLIISKAEAVSWAQHNEYLTMKDI